MSPCGLLLFCAPCERMSVVVGLIQSKIEIENLRLKS